ncbi:phage terminase small subunit P27 family [Vibrio fluvialis]|uniref:phage terminase small subunit P27 family n=1 Tax=Vibrio fluvialis TaxID=676 RepID=UPI0028DF4270|nr:phage terminase small subunit P27 family [Vibrio fluvialis]MDT8865850.1 phage terminase small subunit P27 family [Vibrio fluvialis]MDT8873618.1 phage terminase small subunit P27 family [Vibrio fluvialis]
MNYGILTDEQMVEFERVRDVLANERELKPSDDLAIEMLVSQLGVYREAHASIQSDGALIHSHTAYGQTIKANPANEVMSKAANQIKALMIELMMTPKTKHQLLKPEQKPDEDDPLLELMKRGRGRTKEE